MKRYIVKNKGKWSLVNANYKKSIKNFEKQIDAIQYAVNLRKTTSILLHDKNGKFRKLSGWDQTNTKSDINNLLKNENTSRGKLPQYIPNYVLKETIKEVVEYNTHQKYVWLLTGFIISFLIIAICFGVAYGIEIRRFENV